MAYDSKLKQITVCCKNRVNMVINTIWSLTACRSLLLLSGYTLCSHTFSVWTSSPVPLFQMNHTFIDIACLVYYAYALSPVRFCYHLHSLPLRCWGASFFFFPPSNTNIKPFVAINGPVSSDAKVLELLTSSACWQQTGKSNVYI